MHDKEVKLTKRDWLNIDEEHVASIHLITEYSRKPKTVYDVEFYSNLKICDCVRQINLNFSLEPDWDYENNSKKDNTIGDLQSQYDNQLRKIRLIRDYLSTIETQMKDYMEHFSKNL